MTRRMAGTPVGNLPNIGPKTALRLREAGIETEADLRALGAVAAYRRVKHFDPRFITLNCLYALHAAIAGGHWARLAPEVKARLRAEAEAKR